MIYNLEYYEKMLREYSKTAEYICQLRWRLILELDDVSTVLDYGSGVGWFRAFRPSGICVDSYDIANYPQTGILRDWYDVICLWDVLEHVGNAAHLNGLLKRCKYIALTVPIKPKNVKLSDWKHYKPGEHLHYFTPELLDLFFNKFRRIKSGYFECPPREDILTAIYERREDGNVI